MAIADIPKGQRDSLARDLDGVVRDLQVVMRDLRSRNPSIKTSAAVVACHHLARNRARLDSVHDAIARYH